MGQGEADRGESRRLKLPRKRSCHASEADHLTLTFFAYNGPGSDAGTSWSRSNPLTYVKGGATPDWISCVRPGLGYKWGAVASQLQGSFKLLDCPSPVQHIGGPVGSQYSPHDPFVLLNRPGWFDMPNTAHFRNYGFTDGHVEGLFSQYGY